MDHPAHEVDVAVVGGGPAGAAAALTLNTYSSLSVALIERSNYQRWRAGESLSPGIAPLLQYLGAWDAFLREEHQPAYGTAAAWGSEELVARDFLYTAQGQGWHLDRRLFDASLANLAAARGAHLYSQAAARSVVLEAGGQWRLSLRDARMGAALAVRARFVIDATGSSAAVARRLGARRLVGDHLMGLAGVFQLPTGASTREAFTTVEATRDGWWYSTRLPGNQVVAAFMTDPQIIRAQRLHEPSSWLARSQATIHLREWLDGAALILGPHVRPAYSQLLDSPCGEGWIAAGEAAVGFDPLSSIGIGYALLSGIEAARAVAAALGGREAALTAYAASIAQHYGSYRLRQRAYYLLEQRWPDAPFWARRHAEPGL
ncbi:MAG TPA: tryptophan 7-halogenase [Chloroflexia bacterium]|nr:tryptophan 7-halogenase [Chloroflexia bacterium]